MDKENPLEEIASLFGKDGLAHNDLTRLSSSLESLTTTIKKRAGIADQATKDEEDEDTVKRTLKSDFSDFITGLKLTRERADAKEYFGFKSNNVEKAMAKEDAIAKEKIDKVISEEMPVDNEKNISGAPPDQNKILSDMVEVLIDMRDDKSQKEMLKEVSDIKSIINNQNKKIEMPGGIEPNSEEAKQEDREKLATAIATKLGDIIAELDLGGGSGFGIPDLPDRKPPGRGNGRRVPKKGPTKVPTGTGGGLGKAVMIGGRVLTGAGLALGAYEASEYLAETGYGDEMAAGAGMDAEKAFRENVAPTVDPVKIGTTAEQAQAALENGKPRDIEKLGGREALENIIKGSKISSGLTSEEASNARTNFARTDHRRADVLPKETQLKLSDILNEVNKENTDLKMYTPENSTMLAPIISNKTINNTEQTIMGTSPIPHNNYSGLQNFQRKVSNYY